MDTPQNIIDAYLERIGAVWGTWKGKHYKRSMDVVERVASGRYGKRDDKARYWAKVEKMGELECWNWIASTDAYGYGIFKVGQTNVRAHRFSYLIHKGNIEEGQQVCHTCDNPKCQNPTHLFLGTLLDNQADKVSKNRQYKPGSAATSSITESTALAILKDYTPTKGPRPNYGEIKRLSEKFGLKRHIIARVVKRESWKNLRFD